MKLLLDSHAIAWWVLYPGRMRASTCAATIAPENEVVISAASVWELG